MPTTTLVLIERIRRGDQDAFALLFERTARRLAIRIHYRLNPELREQCDPDDLLQETYLRAARDLGQFHYRSPGSFLRWICSIADHVVADLARFHARQKRQAPALLRFRSLSNPDGPEPATSSTPSRIMASDERYRALIAKLDALPEKYRTVLLHAKMEGLSIGEIADKLGIPRQQVSLLLHRAIRRLQQDLASPPSHG